MIISRTPFRISFVGGGTDLRSYYATGFGSVVSITIDKYIYITVNKRFDSSLRIGYSKTEIVDDVEQIAHPIVRECLKLTGITKGIEITSIADIPAGTGLGSSSSFTVGLLNALYTYRGEQASSDFLARMACHVEMDILGEPIGKQDQYAAAYGGLNFFRFNADETVQCLPLDLHNKRQEGLNKKLLLFYLGTTRSASDILAVQNRETPDKLMFLDKMRDQACQLQELLLHSTKLQGLGEILHQGWNLKRQVNHLISNDVIEAYYDKALKAGAGGGKLLGAGGGGFLLFYCEEEKQQLVREALKELREVDFRISRHGSRIIYLGDE